MRTDWKRYPGLARFFPLLLLFSIPAWDSSGRLYAQDFSESIRTAAAACLKATIEGDYRALARYTHPAVMDMLDTIAGGEGKGLEFMAQQMKEMEAQGVRIDSGTVGIPTPHVTAGRDLMAVVPTVLYMSIEDMRIRQESYMIAISADSGTTWTFVNGSDNVKVMIDMLFPNWNNALQLPRKKGPEIIEMKGDEPEEGTEQ